MDTMAWHPSGQGVEWAGCGAEPLCALGDREVTALYTGVKLSISGSVQLLQAGIREQETSCPCKTPLVLLPGALRWGITVQDSGVEMSPDLRVARGWLGLAGLLQTNGSSSVSRTLLGMLCLESGSVLESLASCYVPMAACLPGRARPSPDSQPHPAPFFRAVVSFTICRQMCKQIRELQSWWLLHSSFQAHSCCGVNEGHSCACSLSLSQSTSAGQEFLFPWWGLRAHPHCPSMEPAAPLH